MGQPQLQELLDSFVVPEGGRAYFNPPDTVEMVYPAIVYNLDFEKTEHADNMPYSRKLRWIVTLISRDPMDPIRDQIAELQSCSFERAFPADQLNHQIFNLYF